MEWSTAGTELPPEWKRAISAHNKRLLGRRGLGRYAWCVAAQMLLALPPDLLRDLASQLRDEAERDWEAFANKWADPDRSARTTVPEIRAAFEEASKRIAGAARSKK